MGSLGEQRKNGSTIFRCEGDIWFIQLNRPERNNAIDHAMVDECTLFLENAEREAKVVVLEGLPEVFCYGADFLDIQEGQSLTGDSTPYDPAPLYDLWLRLATGSFLSIAHVRGKTNAGGVGFVASCDMVVCEEAATFSLSEMLFGLIPACVMPFLIRRVGVAHAHYMTLMTNSFSARQALLFGLVDAVEEDSHNLLRKHLLRVRRLSKLAIARQKWYMQSLNAFLNSSRKAALEMNKNVFSDETNLAHIRRFVDTGKFPWEP